jgi:hypothetical protein
MKTQFLTSLVLLLALNLLPISARAASENGRAGVMPALYDGEPFTINLKQLDDTAAASLIANNASINIIFMSDDGLPGNQPFISVLDAIQGDGFNPIWLEVQIHFTPGNTPVQLQSDDEIHDAVAAGTITLEGTGEVYRCSVIGPK